MWVRLIYFSYYLIFPEPEPKKYIVCYFVYLFIHPNIHFFLSFILLTFYFSPCYSHPVCTNPSLPIISSIWPVPGHPFPLPFTSWLSIYWPFPPAWESCLISRSVPALVTCSSLPICLPVFHHHLLVVCRLCLPLVSFAFYLPARCRPLPVLWHCPLTPAFVCRALQ